MKNEIWDWFDEYNVHVNHPELRKTILNWPDTRERGVYYMPDGSREWDLIIPAKLRTKTEKLIRNWEKQKAEIIFNEKSPIGTQ